MGHEPAGESGEAALRAPVADRQRHHHEGHEDRCASQRHPLVLIVRDDAGRQEAEEHEHSQGAESVRDEPDSVELSGRALGEPLGVALRYDPMLALGMFRGCVHRVSRLDLS